MKLDFGNPASIAGPKLESVMSDRLCTAGTKTSCNEALIIMRDRGIRNLPIMRDEIIAGRGKGFDTEVANEFLALVDKPGSGIAALFT